MEHATVFTFAFQIFKYSRTVCESKWMMLRRWLVIIFRDVVVRDAASERTNNRKMYEKDQSTFCIKWISCGLLLKSTRFEWERGNQQWCVHWICIERRVCVYASQNAWVCRCAHMLANRQIVSRDDDACYLTCITCIQSVGKIRSPSRSSLATGQ